MAYRRDKRGADADSVRDDIELVEDVLDSIRLIEGVVSETTRTTLGDDPIRQAGVERYLARIFEDTAADHAGHLAPQPRR